MSLSNPTTENPVKKFIEYKAEESTFQYWDKKQEKNIPLELPVQFIVLDELATITGYCEVAKSNLYSNEVHNLNLQMLNVKSFKGGVHLMGKYADIKEIWEDSTGFVEFSTRCGLKLSVREIISYWNKFEENKK